MNCPCAAEDWAHLLTRTTHQDVVIWPVWAVCWLKKWTFPVVRYVGLQTLCFFGRQRRLVSEWWASLNPIICSIDDNRRCNWRILHPFGNFLVWWARLIQATWSNTYRRNCLALIWLTDKTAISSELNCFLSICPNKVNRFLTFSYASKVIKFIWVDSNFDMMMN